MFVPTLFDRMVATKYKNSMGSIVTAQRNVLNFGMYIVMMTPTTTLAYQQT
jgi:hypothetical protein